MKLYNYYRSSTSYRVRIALSLKEIEYEYIPINLRGEEQTEQAYKDINPYSTVPLLESGDIRIAQSLAIIDWLEAAVPQPSLLPQTPALRQICKELFYAIATEIHAPNNLAVLSYLKTEFNAGQPALEKWYKTWVHKSFSPIEERLREFSWIKPSLPFGCVSLFEIALIPQIYNARRWNCDLEPFPLLTKVDDHCATLEAFKRAHPAAQIDAVNI